MPRPRTFTAQERALLRLTWPKREAFPVADLCRLFTCSSKTLVREVRAEGLALRKPQRQWNLYGPDTGQEAA
jgi:hypothetical protein